jgi:tRNA threonylcarbamoyladenosine biosynthesis protein TsaB
MASLSTTLILSIDTASLGGSVCLVRGQDVLASVIGEATVSHSSTLLRDIERVLKISRASIQDVALFAAASGPGSFTGLRIGLATVKGLAATLGRPCAGIPTLSAIARAAGRSRATVALLPAGRGELFAQLLSVSSNGTVTEHDVPVHLPPATVIEKYASLDDVRWTGPGAHLYQELIRAQALARDIHFEENLERSGGWQIAPREENLAPEIAALALHRFQNGESALADFLRAMYVRPSDPELREGCR